jgi:hypothetical protein
MNTLKEQVNAMLHGKIRAIARVEYAKANPLGAKRHRPYSLPACVDVMVKMLGRVENCSNADLEAIAHYATTGEVFELTIKDCK